MFQANCWAITLIFTASLLSGSLHGILLASGALPGQAYGTVFALEGAGILVAVLLLNRVRVRRFKQEVGSLSEIVSKNAD